MLTASEISQGLDTKLTGSWKILSWNSPNKLQTCHFEQSLKEKNKEQW